MIMPTIREVITRVDELRPNRFGDNLKIDWCWDVDAAVRNDLIPEYTVYPIQRIADQGAYDLPEGVSFSDIILVYIEGRPIDKIDVRSQNKPGYFYADSKINLFPVPHQSDQASGEIRIVAKSQLKKYTDLDQKLLLPDSQLKIYQWYLLAQIAYFSDDIEGYNNDMMQFNTAWDDYAKQLQRNKPASPLKSKNYM